MTEDFAPDAAKALWQSQELELPRLSSEFLRLRASDVRRIERSEAISGYSAFAAVSAWVAWVFARPLAGPLLTPGVGLPRLIVALLYLAVICSAVWWHRYLPGYAVWIVSWWRYRIWPYYSLLLVLLAGSLAAVYIWALWYHRRQDERVEKEIRALKVLQG
jgi:hypothetical protein